ncbi:hypothetical protein [Actinomadura sp. CNU-125]|uniref:hypothetical protein n=1 Tax=Actinomadura sp. CNU-125 TaxID=1904961 RepID=UPI00096A4C61|nr:hypothetical protein [Actinomadura sp. CNU-125]
MPTGSGSPAGPASRPSAAGCLATSTPRSYRYAVARPGGDAQAANRCNCSTSRRTAKPVAVSPRFDTSTAASTTKKSYRPGFPWPNGDTDPREPQRGVGIGGANVSARSRARSSPVRSARTVSATGSSGSISSARRAADSPLGTSGPGTTVSFSSSASPLAAAPEPGSRRSTVRYSPHASAASRPMSPDGRPGVSASRPHRVARAVASRIAASVSSGRADTARRSGASASPSSHDDRRSRWPSSRAASASVRAASSRTSRTSPWRPARVSSRTCRTQSVTFGSLRGSRRAAWSRAPAFHVSSPARAEPPRFHRVTPK